MFVTRITKFFRYNRLHEHTESTTTHTANFFGFQYPRIEIIKNLITIGIKRHGLYAPSCIIHSDEDYLGDIVYTKIEEKNNFVCSCTNVNCFTKMSSPHSFESAKFFFGNYKIRIDCYIPKKNSRCWTSIVINIGKSEIFENLTTEDFWVSYDDTSFMILETSEEIEKLKELYEENMKLKKIISDNTKNFIGRSVDEILKLSVCAKIQEQMDNISSELDSFDIGSSQILKKVLDYTDGGDKMCI